jgi:DMSO reductase anchor subunit
MNDKRSGEWPLVVFTVAVQLGCGIALAAVAGEAFGGVKPEAIRALAVTVFAAVAFGVTCSAFHLGRPARAHRSLANLATSRFSREVLLTGLFAAAALAHAAGWYVGAPWLRQLAGLAAAALGVAAVAAGAAVYMVPGRPVWNAWWVPASFAGATLSLGGLAAAAVVLPDGAPGMEAALRGGSFVGGLLTLASAVALRARFSASVSTAFQPVADSGVVAPRPRWEPVTFALSVVLGGLLPLAIAALWPSVREFTHVQPSLAPVAILVAIAGITLGRRLMYSLGALSARF